MNKMSKDSTPTVDIMRSQLGRARGLGAAKSGLHHWWTQRVTAMALLPLSLYFVLSVLMLAGDDRAQVAAYLGEPWNTVLFLCLVAALFSHLNLGMQVVIEDYVRSDAKRMMTLLVVKGGIFVLALACAVSILKLAL